MKHRVGDELHFVIVFIAIIWCVFLIDWLIPANLLRYGLIPRDLAGLIGIVTMPFLHNGWNHLAGNTIPLIVTLCLLAGSRANTYIVVLQIIFGGGALLWIAGTGHVHVGASGLVYGLVTFLIVAGLLEGRMLALFTAAIVGLMYGVTLLPGIFPIGVGKNVSWDGHLMGAIAGVLVARSSVKRAQASSR